MYITNTPIALKTVKTPRFVLRTFFPATELFWRFSLRGEEGICTKEGCLLPRGLN